MQFWWNNESKNLIGVKRYSKNVPSHLPHMPFLPSRLPQPGNQFHFSLSVGQEFLYKYKHMCTYIFYFPIVSLWRIALQIYLHVYCKKVILCNIVCHNQRRSETVHLSTEDWLEHSHNELLCRCQPRMRKFCRIDRDAHCSLLSKKKKKSMVEKYT